MALLNKAQVFDKQDIQTVDVEVPEWGGTVRLQGLTGSQRDEFEISCLKGKGKNSDVNLRNIRARLIQKCAVNEDGSPMFDETDIIRLGKKSSKALDRLFAKCQEINGLRDEDVEELAKNSESNQSSDSTTN